MRVLAIDTALNAVAACVWDSARSEPLSSETLPIERGHAEQLLPLVQRVLEKSPGGLDAIDRVAVTTGPGSFTGIRVGIAAARALGLVRKVPVVGVSTLVAFAAGCIGAEGGPAIAAMIDARNGQVYLQIFSGAGRVTVEPRVVSVAASVRLLGSGAVLLTGNAAPVAAIEAWSTGLRAEVSGSTTSPDIALVARLGALADPASAPPLPLYLNATAYKPAVRSPLAPPAPA